MSQIPVSTKQNKHVLWDNPKGKPKEVTAHTISKVIFTIRTPPFNATFWTQKKLLGILRDSQRLWKSQVSDGFVRNPLFLAKQHVVCDKTTRCSWDFKGLFSDYVPRNLFFFPWNFENVRQNWGNIRQNSGKGGESCRMLPFFKIRERERRRFSPLITIIFF